MESTVPTSGILDLGSDEYLIKIQTDLEQLAMNETNINQIQNLLKEVLHTFKEHVCIHHASVQRIQALEQESNKLKEENLGMHEMAKKLIVDNYQIRLKMDELVKQNEQIQSTMLPVEKSSRILDPPETTTTTTNITHVRLRGAKHYFPIQNSVEVGSYSCTIVDPIWTDLPESEIMHFCMSASIHNGIQYVRMSYLTLMNLLVSRGYEIERWDEKKQEVDLKKVHA